MSKVEGIAGRILSMGHAVEGQSTINRHGVLLSDHARDRRYGVTHCDTVIDVQ